MTQDQSTSRGESPAGGVAVRATVASSAVSPNTRVTKLIVAGQPAGIPLGNFHTGEPGFSVPPPYPRDPFERLGFAEVYWAKIPRTIVDEKHTLEEAKKWARTALDLRRLRV